MSERNCDLTKTGFIPLIKACPDVILLPGHLEFEFLDHNLILPKKQCHTCSTAPDCNPRAGQGVCGGGALRHDPMESGLLESLDRRWAAAHFICV